MNSYRIQSSIDTFFAGMHRLAYGIYGIDNTLLASGSEVFDVGQASLIDVRTDREDYPAGEEPVIVTVSLYGQAQAELRLEVEGAEVLSQQVTLNGFTTQNFTIQPLVKGWLSLNAYLDWNGLAGSKAADFGYGYVSPPSGLIASPEDGAVQLSWVKSSDSDAAGYKVYYGLAVGDYNYPIDVGNLTDYVLTNLENGTYYAAVSAYDIWGNESSLSNEVIAVVSDVELIPAKIDIDPDVLNLKSKGKWITCYIELPEGYGVERVDEGRDDEEDVDWKDYRSLIDISSIRLNKQISVADKKPKLKDKDKNGLPELKIKFDRQAVQEILEVGEAVIIVSGKVLHNGSYVDFEGSDTISVLSGKLLLMR